MRTFKEILDTILAESEILRKVSEIKASHGNTLSPGYRNLRSAEIEQLKKQNNYAENWETVSVSENFSPSYIINNRFYGRCLIGHFTGFPLETENGINLPSGIYDSIIKDSMIHNEALVSRCGLIANYIISPYSVVYNTGTITAGKENFFANGHETVTGPETGERAVKIFSEMDMNTAESLMLRENRALYNEFIDRYRELCTLETGYIGKNCRITNAVSIVNSYIDEMTIISGSSLISGSTILCSEHDSTFIGSGVIIEDSIIQYGCSVDSMSVIRGSLLMEYTHAERHCNIIESIIGPDSSIGEAEITSSFTGPFTAAHHHSLLIASIWPGGRGNVGYGANVGSNHTSRLPDQEILPAEGMFFGLGSSVKFPAEYVRAPYSVISTGTVTLPQRVEFPFSLITQPSESRNGLSPLYNEIIPGWILSNNLYSVVRNESKYRKRKKSRRNDTDFSVFRPDIIGMMITARDRLKNISAAKDYYTESDIEGAGKNFITEKNRTEAIQTYTFFIRHYALKITAHRVGKTLSGNNGIDISAVFQDDADIRYWPHAKNVMEKEGLKDLPLKEIIEKLINQNSVFLSSVYSSREKDYTRGNRIISDYSVYHRPTGEDQFINELKNATVIEQTRLEQILKLL